LIALQPVQSTQFSLNVLLQKTFPNQSTAFVNQTVVSVFNDENRLRIAFELIAEHIFQAGTVSGIEIQRNNEMVQCILSADLDDDGLRFFKDLRHVLRQDVPRQFTSSTREQHIQMLRVILSDCGVDFDCSNQGQIYLSFIDVQQGGDKLKILVVDDDDILRETVVALLSIQGHHILTANTAEEAETLWDEAIDVVLLDVNLPKMSGTDLLSKIQIQHPLWVQKTILISGIAEFGRPLGIRFLQKPFSKRQLNEAIEQVTSHVRQ
jgi:CheY-like chemotaxis protein